MASLKMMSSQSAAPISPAPSSQRTPIPGGYGWPVIGPLSDRLNYFWFQGPNNFFKKRIEKYKSTVFRTNVPPAFPFFFGVNPRVVAVLDVKSFSHLFDLDLVEKNVLVGDFLPSLSYTGGMRVCAYIDTAEAKHSQIKNFVLDILKRSSTMWVPSMVEALDPMWDSIEAKLSDGGIASAINVFLAIQQFLFSFLSRCLLSADTSSVPEIEKSGHIMIDKWLALQLAPTMAINAFQPLEELLLHSFRYPFWFVKSDYNKLASFIKKEAKETLSRAQTDFKLTEEEAIHNLLFILGFNAFGGFSIFFNTLIGYLSDQKAIHQHLRNEVRETLSNDVLNLDMVKKMDLINSFVYEALRLSPPVPSQFGRARKDFDLSSQNTVFEIKKGEMLCGFQPIVMQDPEIFENPADFVYDRFSKKEGGHELLKYVFWSNGPQIGLDAPSASNKQCPARDVVPLTAAVFLAHMFQRYDEIEIFSGSITALKAKNK